MTIAHLIGTVLVVATAILAVVLYRGSSKLQKMIEEEKEKSEEK